MSENLNKLIGVIVDNCNWLFSGIGTEILKKFIIFFVFLFLSLFGYKKNRERMNSKKNVDKQSLFSIFNSGSINQSINKKNYNNSDIKK